MVNATASRFFGNAVAVGPWVLRSSSKTSRRRREKDASMGEAIVEKGRAAVQRRPCRRTGSISAQRNCGPDQGPSYVRLTSSAVANKLTPDDHLDHNDTGESDAMVRAREETINVAEAKKQLSNLLGRVAFGGETILIMRRGRPMARLIPPEEQPAEQGLGAVRGWLSDDDPFLAVLDEIVATRARHRPRTLPKRRTSSRR